MTCQTTLAASAAIGAPTEHMPDVIDSLKRLERVGSENSKTTQKLLEAAAELSRAIAEQFADAESEQVELPDGTPAYRVSGRELYMVVPGINRWQSVSSSRAAALKFAEDIADGLLDEFEKSLAARVRLNAAAIAVIESARVAHRKIS